MATFLPASRSRLGDAAWRVALRVAYRLLRAWWFLTRPRHRGTLVALWHEGRILLVRNSYRREVSLPGGSLRRGETAREAAARELREEIGLDVRPEALRDRGVLRAAFHYQDDHCHFFELDLPANARPRPDGREVVAAWLASPEQALRLALVPVARAYLLRRPERGQPDNP